MTPDDAIVHSVWPVFLLVLIPLLGAVLNGFFGKRLGKTFVGFVGVLAPALAFVLGLVLWYRMAGLEANGHPAELHYVLGDWISVAGFSSSWHFVLDRLSTVMVLVITGVGTLIHIYSTGYMAEEDDGGYARYFCYLNLFVASMLVLVLAGDLLVLFIGWEGVGMCSYLLIGFEYRDANNAACGSKAFIVNRIGDFAFMLGMLTLLVAGRGVSPDSFGLDMQGLNSLFTPGAMPGVPGAHELQGWACLLLFIGATGKSAQLPLHLWLPDAMAGPTPVSALIHAATMVTAGIYLIARLSPLFLEAKILGGIPVLGIVAAVGVLTAFYAATCALAQNDIKKVLAYSTISQLGFMFVGVGAAAFGMAVFHLVTHAFFKALLFLGAGSVIHACHSQDMREMGGLRKMMPTTFKTMVIGALALAGLVGFSGFWSKDAILGEVLARGATPGALSWAWKSIYLLGLVTAIITALYSLRLILLTFFGTYRGHGHPHESPPAMRDPLVVLAALALFGGLLGLPAMVVPDALSGVISAEMLPHHLEAVTVTGEHLQSVQLRPDDHTIHSAHNMGLVFGVVAGLLGVIVGWLWWNAPLGSIPWEDDHPRGWMRVKGFLANAWGYDEVLNKQIVQPGTKDLSRLLWKYVDDKTVDGGLVDGTGRVGLEFSNLVRALQTGRVVRYAGYFVVGAIGLPLLAVLFSAVTGAGG